MADPKRTINQAAAESFDCSLRSLQSIAHENAWRTSLGLDNRWLWERAAGSIRRARSHVREMMCEADRDATRTSGGADTVRAGGVPAAAGHYWAKWRIASEGTREADELTPSDTWEVVQVFVNCIEETDPEHFMVSVPGVEKAQPLDGFVWGEGPLKRMSGSVERV